MEKSVDIFTAGVQNLISDELIKKDAASDAKNWFTVDGKIKLVYGKKLLGQEGLVGHIRGQHFGYRKNGEKVHYRKAGTAIQYLDSGGTWTNLIVGLDPDNDVSFANYSSLAGNFTYLSGVDGFFKINNENYDSYIDLYDEAKNDKGFILIDKSRLIMWNCQNASKTSLKLSYIDTLKSTITEAEEIGAAGTDVYTGSLAFKASGAKRNCFAVKIAGGDSTPLNIISASQAVDAVIGFEDIYTVTWIATGDYITLHGIGGMVEMNNLIGKVVSIAGTTITLDIDSSGFTPYAGPNTGAMAEAELLEDQGDSSLKGTKGGTGIINYTSGYYETDFLVNTTTTPVAEYQYEDSTEEGLADFTYSSPRVSGQGNLITQDMGGDKIQSVLVGQDGEYYSLKEQSAYKLAISDDDSSFTNLVYRRDIGIPYWRAGVSTSKGIVFINTANPDRPEITILQRNPLGDNIEPVVLFPLFKFANYEYDECCIDTWNKYIVIACKTIGADNNDTILLGELTQGSLDITSYPASVFSKDEGNLYAGSPISFSTYQLYNGFDDEGIAINNYWISKGEKWGAETLKKVRKLKFKGFISPNQEIEVYWSYDGLGWELAGTISGNASYVDLAASETIGNNMIGEEKVGGGETSLIYPYFCEIKISFPKFRKRKIKLVASKIGYFDCDFISDKDILVFENRIPKKYRVKKT